jgi:hypothetical protein
MITPQSGAVAALAKHVGFDPGLGRIRTRMIDAGAIDKLVAAARADTGYTSITDTVFEPLFVT